MPIEFFSIGIRIFIREMCGKRLTKYPQMVKTTKFGCKGFQLSSIIIITDFDRAILKCRRPLVKECLS
jgi:hypothetical protein